LESDRSWEHRWWKSFWQFCGAKDWRIGRNGYRISSMLDNLAPVSTYLSGCASNDDVWRLLTAEVASFAVPIKWLVVPRIASCCLKASPVAIVRTWKVIDYPFVVAGSIIDGAVELL
jgi:hypothetical protein